MFRKLSALAVAVCFFAGNLFAADYKGQLTKVDAEKGTITVLVGKTKKVEGTSKSFTVAKDAKFVALKGKKGNKTEETLTDGLKNELFASVGDKGGPAVTITTEGEGDKEVVKSLQVSVKKKKKKKAE